MKKKRLVLVLIVLGLNSCTTQKKQLYVFSHYGYITKADGTLKIPGEINKPNLTPINEYDSVNCKQELISNVVSPVQREVRLLKWSKLHLSRRGKVIEEKVVASKPEEFGMKYNPSDETKQRRNGSHLLYLAASLMGLAVIGFSRLLRPVTTRITRWAKANPKKTQGVIAAIHLPLMGLGVMNGHNLYQMGYDTSDTMMYTFGAATALGFLLSPFMPRRETIPLPRRINRQRIGFAGLLVSSLMMMVGFGNRAEHNYPHSPITKAIQSIDQSFYSANTHSIEPDEKVAVPKMLKKRHAVARMSAFGAAIATFFLVILACAGLCLFLGGIGYVASATAGGIAAILLGIGLFWLAIKGIKDVSRKRRLTKAQEIRKVE